MKQFFLLCFVVCVALINSAEAKPILAIQTVQANSGVQAWLVEDSSNPIVSLSFAFRGGTAFESLDKQGSLQLLSTMLDEGAGVLDAKAFQKALKDKSISLSFHAGRDAFYGDLKYLKRYEADALSLLNDALTKPHFAADSLARMKAANSASLNANLSDPGWIAGRLLMDTAFKNHVYRQNSMGTLETLNALTADDLKAQTARLFTRANLVVGIAGDVTPRETKRVIDTGFANLPAGVAYQKPEDAVITVQTAPSFYALPIGQTALLMAWPALAPADPDWFAQRVLNHIFAGGGFSARLMQAVRDDSALTYGISSDIDHYDSATLLVLSSTLKTSGVPKAQKLITETIETLKATPVPPAELQAAQDYLVGSQVLQFSSTSRISDALLGWQLLNVAPDYIDTWMKNIKAVTPADIQRVANKVFAQPPVVSMAGGKPRLAYKEQKELPNVTKPTH